MSRGGDGPLAALPALAAWDHVPLPPTPRPASRPLGLGLAVAVVLLAPVARALALPATEAAVVAIVGLVALALVLAAPPAWWPARVLVAGAAGVGVASSQGDVVGAQLLLGLVLGPWVAFDRPPLPGLPAAARAAAPGVLVLCLVSAVQGRTEAHRWQPLVPLVAALLLPVLLRVGGGVLRRAGDRVGALAAAGVSTVCFLALGTVVVVLPWCVQRLLRRDPLRPRRGWVARDRAPVQPAQPWAPDPATLPPPDVARRRTTLAAVVGVAAATALLAGSVGPDRARAAVTTGLVADDGRPQAHRADAWYPDHVEDVAWLLDERVALRPFEVYRLRDATTRTVDIQDSYRVSTSPPPCGCPRLTVWLYGGGGAFGFEQRDEHTIASELAAVAAEAGIVLDVANRGMPGQAHWRAALRFAWDLAVDPPPDLVLFYGGAEEVEGAEALASPPVGDIGPPYEAYVEQRYDDVFDIDPLAGPPAPPDGVELVGRPRVAPLSPAEVGALATTRHRRSLALSDDTAEAAGIPVRYAWQPSRYTRAEVEVDSGDDEATDRRRTATFATATRTLDRRVIDLTDVFAGVDEPLFVDAVHHNEQGARLVAAALFAELAPQLEALLAARGGPS